MAPKGVTLPRDPQKSELTRMDSSEPQIQYFRAQDGVNLAYWTLGSGQPALIVLPGFPMSHLEREWAIPRLRSFYQFMAMNRTLIRFDWRGTGLSERDVDSFDVNLLAGDILALMRKLEIEQAAVFAAFTAGPIALNLALEHPEKVSHLVLWHSFSSTNAYYRIPRIQSMSSLAATDWEFFVEAATLNRLGWTDAETAQRTVDLVMASYAPAIAAKIKQESQYWDFTARIHEIETPTLVLHRRDFHGMKIAFSTDLAARMPNAKLMILDGAFGYFYGENVHSIARIIDDFLSKGKDQHSNATRQFGDALTARELEILTLLAAGLRDKEIAARLNLTTFTVHRHVANVYKKIDAHGRADATAFAMREGLLL